MDRHQLSPSFHFDSESLSGGSIRINTLKERVISNAKGGDGISARKALGGALHTIQDYFAHSNQADQGLSIPNFGIDVLSALPSNVATCSGSFINPGSTLLPGAGLTTGYFTFPLCNPPGGKCKHGLPICPGIAKDSPTHPLHGTAYNNAVIASKKFVLLILNDPRMTSDPKAIKRLMDIRPMIGAVIDDTGSMGGVIRGVSSAVASIVATVKGTPDEPDKYLLERFGDPTVGTPSLFADSGDFLAAVNSIIPDGGDDCPELSMSGTYTAVVAADRDSRLFLFTDASAKDAGLMSAVANLATKKRIQVTTALSGNCSPYDSTYFELARRTGGQVFITTRSETGTTLANLMKPLVRNDVHLVSQASLNLAGESVIFPTPIDDTVQQSIFSVGMITKGGIALRRPNGVLVKTTDTDVTITDTVGSRTFTINNPEPGNWKVEVTGTGTTLISVMASTSTFLQKFEFAEMAGRTEHQGLFPIDGSPIIDKTQTVRAVIEGAVNSPVFSFRRPDGVVISTFSMANGNSLAATDEEFVGEVNPPIGPFLVYVSGQTPAGQEFQRVLPGQIIASSVEVRSASDLTSVPAGRSTAVAFSITNHGAPASFALTTVDSRNYVTSQAPSPILLGTDESRIVTVNVSPPMNTDPDTEFAVTLTAMSSTEDTSNSASIFLTVDPGNSEPVCSSATANPAIIRKKNHKMVPVAIVGVTDADNDPVQIKITAIAQDEPIIGRGSGSTAFDAIGIGAASAEVRAERAGRGDGRVYRIAFDALDGKGGICSGSVKVEVPHDNRTSANDSGSGFNSLGGQ